MHRRVDRTAIYPAALERVDVVANSLKVIQRSTT
jgi:hypothetical protein